MLLILFDLLHVYSFHLSLTMLGKTLSVHNFDCAIYVHHSEIVHVLIKVVHNPSFTSFKLSSGFISIPQWIVFIAATVFCFLLISYVLDTSNFLLDESKILLDFLVLFAGQSTLLSAKSFSFS